MPREHARILCARWAPGSDFRSLTPMAQRTYDLINSQPQINNAGVIPLQVAKWARCSLHTTTDDIWATLTELVEHRYVVIDEETEELLVRTFIRGDGILKQPNILINALRVAQHIESPKLRTALATELVRIGTPPCIDAAAQLDLATVQELMTQPVLVPAPPPSPSVDPDRDTTSSGTDKPGANPSGEPGRNPSTKGSGNPSARAAGRGGGRGRGKGSSPVGGEVGGTRGRDPRPAPPPNLDPNNPRCGRHADIPAHDPGPDCRVCRRVRIQIEDAAESGRATDPRAADRAEHRAAIDACTRCDDRGLRELDDGRAARCRHDQADRASAVS